MIARERLRLLGTRFSLAPLEPYWHRAGTWWSERSLREQILLGTLAAIAIFTLLLMLVIVPLRDAREDAQARIRDAALIEARLRAGGDLTGSIRFRGATASAIVTDSAAAAALTIERIEPEGTATRVVLGGAPFEQVMHWIAEIEQNSRLRVREADIERQPSPGLVSATIVLEG